MRRLALCLVLPLLTAGLVACSDDDGGSSSEPAATDEATTTTVSIEEYCAAIQAGYDLAVAYAEGDAPDDVEEQFLDLLRQAQEMAPPDIEAAYAATLVENDPEAQATIDDFNRERCGVDASTLPSIPAAE